MAIEMDYVIGAGILLVSTVALLGFVSNLVTAFQSNARVGELEKTADYLGELAEKEVVLNSTRIGIASWAYAADIVVDNNLGQTFNNELVSFDLGTLGYADIDLNSVAVYDGDASLNYQRSGTRIDFVGSVPPGRKIFRAFWDDDSNFTDRGSSLGSTGNNLTEEVNAPERFLVLQYRKMQNLSSLDYNSTRQGFNWRLRVENSLGVIIDYGISPGGPNVIVRKVPVISQAADGDIFSGLMTLEVG